jgi:hypothetical protein
MKNCFSEQVAGLNQGSFAAKNHCEIDLIPDGRKYFTRQS